MSNAGMGILLDILESTENYLQDVTEERDYYRSIYDAFFSGNAPQKASLEHMVVSQWGRKRLESMKCKPVLLVDSNK